MRKMMSIVFLLLVLLISLGFSCCLRVEKEGMEDGVEADNATDDEPKVEAPESENVEEESKEEGEPVADVKPEEQPSTFNVSPMEGSCTETMSNYN
jgi:hypothetical protein